jgi:4-amino-4-deoxy-L-arabinose transferase-like glycosyltransferase
MWKLRYASVGCRLYRLRASAIAALPGLIFVALGMLFIGYPGIQNDEAIFASPLYVSTRYDVPIGKYDVTLMLMNYAGCLKTWIYSLIFSVFKPSALSLRVPVVLLGAVVVVLVYFLLAQTRGRRAALLGSLLLATDPVFLLTDCFDWGPVALQHLFLVLTLLTAFLFSRTRNRAWLFLLFFFSGLGLWDKALFSWLLVGMVVAAICIFPRELRGALSIRNALTATFGFALGALPLIYFNVEFPLETFRSNTALSLSDFRLKEAVLSRTADGSSLFGYLVREESAKLPREPASRIERASLRIRRLFGEHQRDLMPAALLGALLCLPFLWRTPVRRFCLFAFITAIVAWIQMAITKGAGGAAHHAILLWPLPQLFVAAVLAQLSIHMKRYGAAAIASVAVVLLGSNFLVINQYFSQLTRYGSPAIWSDATYALSRDLGEYRSHRIFVVDWGIVDPMTVLHRGQLQLLPVGSLFLPGNVSKKDYAAVFSDKDAIWVTHTLQEEQFKGIYGRVGETARSLGFVIRPIGTINDRNERAIFQLFRVESALGLGAVSYPRAGHGPALLDS